MNRIFPQQSDHPLFRYLSSAERKRIEDLGEVRTIAPGGYLIGARQSGSTLFAVEDGHLDIFGLDDGAMTVLATVGPGDVIGEVSFIDDSPRSLAVKAGEEEVMVRAWDKKKLSDALAADPDLLSKFAVAMCELLVERLRDTARRV
ncbi:MAG TPA: cyclic nucleotide-binding domain-containing protein [Thermoanaerobaculia bacterium]|nr:cyclic nucleotide-binding domain-containing protein [Thermoanaerobaculia bacterium]